MGRYDFKKVGEDQYELYEDGALLCPFSRYTFREDMGHVSSSNGWIGAILRLFHKKFPLPYRHRYQSPLERITDINGERGIADYLRSKGYRVVKLLQATDRELIAFIESQGYVVEGLLDGAYYSTLDPGKENSDLQDHSNSSSTDFVEDHSHDFV